MAIRRLKFSISSYWQAGSGAGHGAIADSIVLRDAYGLPVIPGRTVKGLVRDAMELATLSGRVSQDRIVHWFGSALPGHGENLDGDEQEVRLEKGRFSTKEGALWFGSAQLGKQWRDWVRASDPNVRDDITQALYVHLASTAIDGNGTALAHSLRVREVAVPMELHAEIRGPDDLTWIKDVEKCLPLLRTFGSRRHRGYGRVDVRLEE